MIGSALRLGPDSRDFQRELLEQCGDLGWIHIGRAPVLVVTDPQLIREVLRSDTFVPSSRAEIVRPLIGDFLYFQPPDIHRQHRRIMSSLFTPKQVRTQRTVVRSMADATIAQWPTGTHVDLEALLHDLLLRIGSRVFLGPDSAQYSDDIVAPLHLVIEHFARMFNGVSLPLNVPTPRNRRVRAAIASLMAVAAELLERERRHPSGELSYLSVVDAAQRAGADVTDRDICHSVCGVFLASAHSSASSLGWATYFLTEDAAAHDRLRQEIANTPEGDDPPYATAVLREAMRLRPPNATLVREATSRARVGTVTVESGTAVYLLVRAMHRLGYPQPDEFRPSRFADDDAADDTLPFGLGSHYCIGSPFAMMQNPIVLTSLFSQWQIARPTSAPPAKPYNFFMQRAPATPFTLTPR